MKITARVGLKDSGMDIPQPPLGCATTDIYLKSHNLSVKEFFNIISQLERLAPNPSIVITFIEGLDKGLDPKEQRELIDKIKGINNEGHLIFITYSPYIVDKLDASQVQIWYRGKYKLLSEHPNYEWAKRTLKTGELWDAEGEEWIKKVN